MKGQRGQVLILVLILLAVGTLVIVPVLDYITTGLRSQQISEDTMAKQCVADSSVEDALWKLLNELDLNNPAANYSLYGANIDIQVPRIAASAWHKYAEIEVKVDIEPNWLGTSALGTTYVIRINMPQWELTNIVLPLPEGLTYKPATSYYKGPDMHTDLDADAEVNIYDRTVEWGPDNPPGWVDMMPAAEPTITGEGGSAWVEGKQVVEWNLSFPVTGKRTFILICEVEGDPGWGIHYVQPSFGGVKLNHKTAALSSGIYKIRIDYQGVTYEVVAAYGPDGFEIISYQIVE
ncbi:hypothetical protein ES703_121093 [subsurface metagenome]